MLLCLRIEKDLAPYRIGKHSNPQNRAKMLSKIQKIRFLVYFCPLLIVEAFSYSVGGQVFFAIYEREIRKESKLNYLAAITLPKSVAN